MANWRWLSVVLLVWSACRPSPPPPEPSSERIIQPEPVASAPSAAPSFTAAARPKETEGPSQVPPLEPTRRKAPAVSSWCELLLRQDKIPFRCAPDAANQLTPEQLAACPDEDKIAVLDSRFVLKGTGDDRAVWFEVPALKQSVKLVTHYLLDSHIFSIKSFPKVRHAEARLYADMAYDRVGFCSTEGRLLISMMNIDMDVPGQETLETLSLPPRTRVRLPSYEYAGPRWTFGSPCPWNCQKSSDLCDTRCESKYADGWGVLSEAGYLCTSVCRESLEQCDFRCRKLGQFP